MNGNMIQNHPKPGTMGRDQTLSTTSVLRWAGSKRKLVPLLSTLIPPDFARYVEPFAGSACLFFHIQPRKALLADINFELINAYRQLKKHPTEVSKALKLFPDRSAETYYIVRAQQPNTLSAIHRAARFIFLNRLCFNGLYRTNTKGNFNVPYGGARAGEIPTKKALLAVSNTLRNASLSCASFEKILAEIKSNDFIYLDPPYSISNRRVFNNYSPDVFGKKNLRLLKNELKRLDSIGAQFLLSYGLSKEGIDLAKGFHVRHASVQRQISGFSTHRRKARELLITNY